MTQTEVLWNRTFLPSIPFDMPEKDQSKDVGVPITNDDFSMLLSNESLNLTNDLINHELQDITFAQQHDFGLGLDRPIKRARTESSDADARILDALFAQGQSPHSSATQVSLYVPPVPLGLGVGESSALIESVKTHIDAAFASDRAERLRTIEELEKKIPQKEDFMLLTSLLDNQKKLLTGQEKAAEQDASMHQTLTATQHILEDVQHKVVAMTDRVSAVFNKSDRIGEVALESPTAPSLPVYFAPGPSAPAAATGSTFIPATLPLAPSARITEKLYHPKLPAAEIFAFFKYALSQRWFCRKENGVTRVHRDLREPFRTFLEERNISRGVKQSYNILKEFLADTIVPEQRSILIDYLGNPAEHPLLNYHGKLRSSYTCVLLGWEWSG